MAPRKEVMAIFLEASPCRKEPGRREPDFEDFTE
jgi:hypothetical protein